MMDAADKKMDDAAGEMASVQQLQQQRQEREQQQQQQPAVESQEATETHTHEPRDTVAEPPQEDGPDRVVVRDDSTHHASLSDGDDDDGVDGSEGDGNGVYGGVITEQPRSTSEADQPPSASHSQHPLPRSISAPATSKPMTATGPAHAILSHQKDLSAVMAKYQRMIGGKFGQGRQSSSYIPPGYSIPSSAPPPQDESPHMSYYRPDEHHYARTIVTLLASVPCDEYCWNRADGKVTTLQLLVARILNNDTEHALAIEGWLKQQQKPWGRLGSRHPLHRSGDYDFTSIGLAFLLHRFPPDLVPPDLKRHLRECLLPAADKYDAPRFAVPRAIVGVLETENHLLMINGTLYLTALSAPHHQPTPSKAAPVVQLFLRELMDEILNAGLWEFNSLPYLGYTVIALLILNECSHSSAQHFEACRKVLDYLSFTFALGSFKFKRWAPYRRRSDYNSRRSLFVNAMSHIMMVWAERAGIPIEGVTQRCQELNARKSIFAIACRYSPPRAVLRLANDATAEYFARIGHGAHSSPELFAAAPGWLLSAGGVSVPKYEVVGRETMLFLNAYDSQTAEECIHLNGSGDWRGWNNTGVLFNFAISSGRLHRPLWVDEASETCERSAAWQVRKMRDGGPVVALYGGAGVSAIGVFDADVDCPALLKSLERHNARLPPKGEFTVPAFGCMAQRHNVESFHYDLLSSRLQWTITAVNGMSTFRDVQSWPRVEIAGKWSRDADKSWLRFSDRRHSQAFSNRTHARLT
ncbi:hypothetical protein PTSG_00617 [Salpingoeca rosetta]|uniref:Uncharacterized protein n=1 Tax=Salpingoeca rosetta (strain ATCC 50818 / BSB-021) TaxID=946362 RepID=F2TWZ9_SALR5|nr:uncharacterized protein PTSG_00617 [Salpingoeca rosetta]EGD75908.1 hypothetical protein PTSG_00617 [Salpingoeca rosetta]|eukprot:XP_004998084.1 hypothetical protein PTSG_00617 [Salpingoeca rosetta]